MRLTHADIAAFGRFEELQLELDQAVVVLLGPNEAGKSTLFNFFEAMLYGFYPANRDTYPYVPWGGANAEGSLSFRLDDGRSMQVSRRLMSSPSSQLVHGETLRELRNKTLPAIGHVDRSVFAAVYALTLHDMAALEAGAWEEVQDRLLGGMNVDFLTPARTVIEHLESRAKSLWREDARGKPRAKELQKERRDLKKEREEAAARDLEIREISRRIDEKSERLERVQEELVEVETSLVRAERVRPVQQRLRQIREYRRTSGDIDRHAALPEQPEVWRMEKAQQLDNLRESRRRIREDVERLTTDAEAPTRRDERILEMERRLREIVTGRSAHQDRANRLQEQRRQADAARGAVEREAERLLVRWDEAAEHALEALSVPELSQRVKKYEDVRRERASLRSRVEAWEEMAVPLPAAGPRLVLALLGVLLLLAGFLLDVMSVAVAGAALAALGAALWYSVRAQRRARRRPQMDDRLSALENSLLDHRQAVQALLESVPLPDSRIQEPDAYLVQDLVELRRAVKDCTSAATDADEIAALIAEDVDQAQRCAAEAGIVAEGDFSATVQRIEEALHEATVRRDKARDAVNALASAKESLQALEQDLVQREQEVADVERLLAEIGDGTISVGVERLLARREAAARAEALEHALEEQFPDWKSIVERAERDEGAGADFSDEDVVRAQKRRKELEEERAALRGDLEGARERRKGMLEQETVDQIDSRIAYLEDEVDRVARERDRLQLLVSVVRQADQRHRDKHQPDVLRRAGSYLAAVTDGRYDRIVTDEVTGALSVLGSRGNTARSVSPPLSQGTRDQVYLALRLAIADHLDDGRERLPLFLDETFVNWDRQRRQRGLNIVREMAGSRQIFVFTCHPWFADEVLEETGASLLEVKAPKELLATPHPT